MNNTVRLQIHKNKNRLIKNTYGKYSTFKKKMSQHLMPRYEYKLTFFSHIVNTVK